MARITGEILIDRSATEVFDFVADERNEPCYNPKMLSVEKLSAGPIGGGTRFRAQMRSGGRGAPMLIEFTTFERPLRLGSRASFLGMTSTGELTFEPRGDATLMRWTWDVVPRGVLRFLSPIVAWIGRRQEREIWSELKHCLEQERPLLPAQGPADR